MPQVPYKPTTSANAIPVGKGVLPSMTHNNSKDEPVIKLDIEHALVEDDPRIWSDRRKSTVLCIVSSAAMIAGLCANIQNPANAAMQQDLGASAFEVGLSLSLFILVQGNFPVVWSVISEIKGRKRVFLASIVLFTAGSAVVAVAKNIGLVIGMRVVQAAGSSAVITIGAATLADIFEPHQRGTVMGVFYSAPLLGPSIGPIVGGGLTQALGWRAVFWFLVIFGGFVFFAFLVLFKDTFREERSLIYQNVLKRYLQEHKLAEEKDGSRRERHVSGETISEDETSEEQTHSADQAAQPVVAQVSSMDKVKLSIADVNPFPPYLQILSHLNNICILISSGLLFAFSFSITYTCARTLSLHYNYNALTTGLVLLAFGIGSMLGSVLGGRWSDKTFARLKAANDGVGYPEMRLESTKYTMPWLPPIVVAYAWASQEHMHVVTICGTLFLSGFFSTWMYASTLAYIVDANVGWSSSAVAANSSFRGFAAFVAAVSAVPLQDAIGDGGLYTLWGCLLWFAELLMLLVFWKGKQWRETPCTNSVSEPET